MNVQHVSRHSIAKPDRTSNIEYRIKKEISRKEAQKEDIQ
jgi:hypothetical protein